MAARMNIQVSEYLVKIRFHTRREAEEVREAIVACLQVVPDDVERIVREKEN